MITITNSYGGNNMKKAMLYMFICIILAVFCSVSLAAVPLKVTVGKGTIVRLKEPSKRVSLSNPEIADVNIISPAEVLINGKKIGTTNLIVWDAKGKTTFFDIEVTGDIGSLASQVQEMAPGSDVTVEMSGDALILKGTINNEMMRKKIEQLAQAYAPKDTKVVDLITLKEAQQVVLEVRVAQIDKTKLKEFGVSALVKGKSSEGFMNLIGAPSGQASTQNVIPNTTTSATGIAGNVPGLGSFETLDTFQLGVSHFPSGVGAVLNALQQNGLAKILAQPNLVVRSGEEGRFLVGTKVPIQTITGTGANLTPSITFEQVGIKLNFKPEVLDTGAIRLKIDPAEVSNIIQFLTFANGISAPEIDTRQISTSVDLKDGESLILAGLLSEEMKKNIQKLPLFGDIPILGALFRSTSDELTKKELAFFITPRLVKPIPPGVKTELPQERAITPEEEKEFKWIPLGK
jgi:pilus assembly protein CpaC